MRIKVSRFKFSVFSLLLAAGLFAASGLPPLPVLMVTPDSTVNPNDGTLTLTWGTNNVPSTNFVVLIQRTTNLALPMTNWTLVATVPGTNLSYIATNGPESWYYSGGFSNARGFIPFTNVLLHPQLLQQDSLSGKRGTN